MNTLTVYRDPGKTGAPGGRCELEVSEDKAGATFQLAPRDYLEVNLVPEKSLAAPIPEPLEYRAAGISFNLQTASWLTERGSRHLRE